MFHAHYWEEVHPKMVDELTAYFRTDDGLVDGAFSTFSIAKVLTSTFALLIVLGMF